MLKNKYIRLAAMLLGSFAIINVGMFFFLKTTQPKIGPRVETAAKIEKKAPADTVAHLDALPKADSTMVPSPAHIEPAVAQNAADSVKASSPADTSRSQPPIAASLVSSPEPAMPTPPEPEKKVSSVDSTPVASVTDSTAKDTMVAAAVIPGNAKELSKLAKLLESVKPEEAASIASQLDIEQIVALVMKMKDRNAGRMLAAMPPEQAARVALRMSQMVALTRGKS